MTSTEQDGPCAWCADSLNGADCSCAAWCGFADCKATTDRPSDDLAQRTIASLTDELNAARAERAELHARLSSIGELANTMRLQLIDRIEQAEADRDKARAALERVRGATPARSGSDDGLTIVPLGEDGDTYIAAGHVEPARFLAACRDLDHWLGGAMDDLSDDEWRQHLRHVEVALVPRCAVRTDAAEWGGVDYGPDEVPGHPKDCD
jgi:hypothetical protein